MRNRALWLITLLLLSALLAGCTRDRPAPEETTTVELPAQPVTVEPEPVVEIIVADPEVATVTPDPDEAQDGTPTPDPEGTPEVFQYIVSEGDTLLSIALDFGTDVETIRERNNLFSDEIQIGLPLLIPYVEGVYVPGMPTPTPGPLFYAVQAGDTLGSIALKFNTEPLAIVEANNLLDQNSLYVGQELKIPGQVAAGGGSSTVDEDGSAIASGDSAVHVVQVGESLYAIAGIYDVDANDIAIANNVSNWNTLRVGQELIIPGISPDEFYRIRGQIHVVKPGESLSEIAAEYGKTVSELITANDLRDPDAITVGLELVIPE